MPMLTEAAVISAIISGVVALFGTVLVAFVNWRRSKLEDKRIQHEKQKWLLDLHAELERNLHTVRLEEYPAVFMELERLSHFRLVAETSESLRDLAEKLNAWGYGRAGLCMSDRTRDALFTLRNEICKYIEGNVDCEALMAGPRTDLIEWLRRDLNHSGSTWRNLPTLLSEIQKTANQDGNSTREG